MKLARNLLRLPQETPAKQTLHEARRPVKKSSKPRLTLRGHISTYSRGHGLDAKDALKPRESASESSIFVWHCPARHVRN